MYFIDELNGGSLYKYTSAANWREITSCAAGYFDAGQTFVLRVGDGTTPNATGAYTWVPITDETVHALPGAITITDPNGVTSVDGRNTTDLPQFKGTDYQRPEDMQIQTVSGVERLYVATTTTNEIYALDLGRPARSQCSPTGAPPTSRPAAWSARPCQPGQPRARPRRQHLHRGGSQRWRRRRHLVRHATSTWTAT